ncbi:MAG: cob(I)yrinic acid a,c-diamide adenosyltransferase [Actinobacteria bacterium]|nr:MAG: cob(I)yrinic acid a,c-diamide adenosyltransferase [Actinomycetota bacterium]
MRIYTRKGDDGTTGLFLGGRVAKDATGPEAYGAVDEAVSALGMARAAAEAGLAAELLDLQRQLFVVGAELATLPENRAKLDPGVSLATTEMVEQLERRLDRLMDEVGAPTDFVVPGGSALAATLDHARSVMRRAERRAVTHHRETGVTDSRVVPYLNRLNDLLFMLARAAEKDWTPLREGEPA